jgi:hypothetical protein
MFSARRGQDRDRYEPLLTVTHAPSSLSISIHTLCLSLPQLTEEIRSSGNRFDQVQRHRRLPKRILNVCAADLEIPGSNLGRYTCCSDWQVKSRQENVGLYLLSDHDRFLPCLFQFTVHNDSSHDEETYKNPPWAPHLKKNLSLIHFIRSFTHSLIHSHPGTNNRPVKAAAVQRDVSLTPIIRIPESGPISH